MDDNRIFTAFNFSVEIRVADDSDRERSEKDDSESKNTPKLLCKAAFAECDGLEMSMEPKTFHQGGQNREQIHLAGVVSYGQLTLKRGMSKDFGLWRWFTQVTQTEQRGRRGQATVTMCDSAQTDQITFKLKDCLPIKLRAPALNAKEGGIAIEELQLVYAAMELDFSTPKPQQNDSSNDRIRTQLRTGAL